MPKVIRLFLKDVFHLWPEILLSLLLAVGFAATQYLSWPAFRHHSFGRTNDVVAWATTLLILSWVLLIARAVQDESLVGNRQFWVTRPYGWASILGAKLLFILCFILLPFLIAQCSLIHRAGLSAGPVLPFLLLISGCIFCFALLPLLAVSTVTSNIGHIILVALGVAVYSSIATYLVDIMVDTPGWQPHTDSASSIFLILAPVLCGAVVFVQYAFRRTGISIALLLAVVALGTVFAAVDAKTHWLEKPYPTAAQNQPFMGITLAPPTPDSPSNYPAVPLANSAQNLALRIPLHVSLAPGHVAFITASQKDWELQPAQTGSNGSLNKDWDIRRMDHLSDNDTFRESLVIQHADFTPGANPMLSLHLIYAVEEYEAVATDTVAAAETINVPENGRCITVSDSTTDVYVHQENAELDCMYAGHSPSLTRVQYRMRTSCSALAPDPQEKSVQRVEWIGESHTFQSLALSGVATTYPNLPTLMPSNSEPLRLCPGDPIVFTRYRFVRRGILKVDLPPFDPMPYRTNHPDNPTFY